MVIKEDINSYKKLLSEMFDTSKGYIDLEKNLKNIKNF